MRPKASGSLFKRAPLTLITVALGVGTLILACSSMEPETQAPRLIPTYSPDHLFEEQLEPNVGAFSDMTIEEIKALFRAPDEQSFLDGLGILTTDLDHVSVELEQDERRAISIAVSNDGPAEFEWDFSLSGDAEWLSAFASPSEMDTPPDRLVLEIDAAGLEPGTYETAVTITTQPTARKSPKRIPVTISVLAAEGTGGT